ncbi:MAG: hypothetical protein IPM64_00840 [Phycisphaerales bacterium]|nr:hypothetical protein [Phycisphaerales bacterium]
MTMRSMWRMGVIGVATAVFAAPVLAQNKPAEPAEPAKPGAAADEGGQRRARGGGEGGERRRGPEGRGGEGRQFAGAGMIARVADELQLSEEQRQEVLAVVADHFRAIRDEEEQSETGQAIRALREQMRQAREAGDQEQLAALREEMRKLNDGGGEDRRARMEAGMEALREKIMPLLNEEQQAKFAKMDLSPAGGRGGPAGAADPRRIRAALANLDLDAEQKAAVEELMRAAREQMEALPREDVAGRAEIGTQLIAQVRGLLTDEQRAKLERELNRGRGERGREGAPRGGEGRERRGRGGNEEAPKDPA